MKRIVIAAELTSQGQLNDIAHRLYHHFSFVSGIRFCLFLSPKFSRTKCSAPPIFGQMDYQVSFDKFCESFIFRTVKSKDDMHAVAFNAYAVFIYSEEYYRANHAVLKTNNPRLYWCDPEKTRQEGSNFIQAALDCLSSSEKQKNEQESREKFLALREGAINKYQASAVLATGPSVERFRSYDFSSQFVIACNSTILNPDLVAYTKPKVLVFADPIFHFGVSQYADSFRDICKKFLDENKNVFVIVPIKYYALLKSLMHGNISQIIGVPFTKHKAINVDVSEDAFYTYTTANILTLLLLPLATTFSDSVNIIGCDGRSLSDDAYFWGHGKSVQINDKMTNIQECHPGFFNIDYNEYYFEHCHTLDNFINQAELKGKKFSHLGNTYIPALAQRSIDNQLISPELIDSRFPKNIKHLLIEPDGESSSSGHYFDWHLNFAHRLIETGSTAAILAREDAEYLSADYEINKIFNARSWELQRAKGSRDSEFPYNAQVRRFYSTLKSYLERYFADNSVRPVHIYMYYGSVQAVKCFLELQKEFSEYSIFFTVCVFHESVNLSREEPLKNFHPDAKKILTEAAAKMPQFRLFAVTEKLSEIIYSSYEVKLPVMAHPLINASAASEWIDNYYSNNRVSIKDEVVLYMPCRLGHQKSDERLFLVIRELVAKTNSLRIKLRNSQEARDFVASLESPEEISRFIVLDDLDSSKSYFEELCKSDIVFLPYTPEGFYARTSGVLNDAILAKKPVITIAGTWLADRALALRSGLYVARMNSDSLFFAVRNIVSNYFIFETNLQGGSSKILQQESFVTLDSQVRCAKINQFSDRLAG